MIEAEAKGEIVMSLRVARAIHALANGTNTAALTSRYVKAAAAAQKTLDENAEVVAWARVLLKDEEA